MELDKWLSQLDVTTGRVLDIGGAQISMPKRVKSWNVEEYIIADLPNPHEDSPKPDVELDLNKIDNEGLPVYPDELYKSFDTIFCLEVFDYVYDPMTAFRYIHQLLKTGGIALVSFPSFYPLHQPVQDDALRYMPGAITKLANSVGLEIVQIIKRRPETNLFESFFRAERMRAAKHEDHMFTGFIVEFKK